MKYSEFHRVDRLLGDLRLRMNGGLDYANHWRRQDIPEFKIYRVGRRLFVFLRAGL